MPSRVIFSHYDHALKLYNACQFLLCTLERQAVAPAAVPNTVGGTERNVARADRLPSVSHRLHLPWKPPPLFFWSLGGGGFGLLALVHCDGSTLSSYPHTHRETPIRPFHPPRPRVRSRVVAKFMGRPPPSEQENHLANEPRSPLPASAWERPWM